MKTLWAIALILLIAASSSLRPVVDQTRYFLLSSTPPQQTLAKQGTIGISHIELPEYLQKREIAWRSGDQETRYAANLQWGEPLERMIGRIVASDMGALLAPDFRRGEVQAEISISFSHFESDETGKVTVEATWTIRYPSGNPTRCHTNLSSQ